jgi:hypothetical protein
MLNDLGWISLEARREANQLTYLYKIVNNIVNIKPDSLQPKITRLRRGNNNQFNEITAKTDIYIKSFLPRTVRKWNKLQEEVISAKNHHKFRSMI